MKVRMEVSLLIYDNYYGVCIERECVLDEPSDMWSLRWICYGYGNRIYVSKKECLKHSRFLGGVCSMMIGDNV